MREREREIANVFHFKEYEKIFILFTMHNILSIMSRKKTKKKKQNNAFKHA